MNTPDLLSLIDTCIALVVTRDQHPTAAAVFNALVCITAVVLVVSITSGKEKPAAAPRRKRATGNR